MNNTILLSETDRTILRAVAKVHGVDGALARRVHTLTERMLHEVDLSQHPHIRRAVEDYASDYAVIVQALDA